MQIHRSHPESRFTVIPDTTLRDARLSYRARGVLADILSRPDDWAADADTMSRRAQRERPGGRGEGRDAIRAVFAELEAAGYMRRVKVVLPNGRWVKEVHVYDTPVSAEAAAAFDWLNADRGVFPQVAPTDG